MSHRQARLAGLAAMLAALTFAPQAIAAGSPGQGQGANAKAKQYAKQCRSKAKRARGTARCVKALNKLATGKSSSPRSACAGLSRKRAKGERRSAFARCVTAGSKLVKERKKAGRKGVVGDEEELADGYDDDSSDLEDDEDDGPPPGVTLEDGYDDLDAVDPAIDPLDMR